MSELELSLFLILLTKVGGPDAGTVDEEVHLLHGELVQTLHPPLLHLHSPLTATNYITSTSV
jgi:hypothetical protein